MNSNKLDHRHMVQMAILIILFILVLVGAAWVYKYQFMQNRPLNRPSIESLLEKRFEGGAAPLSAEEKALVEARHDGASPVSDADRQKLEERFNKKR